MIEDAGKHLGSGEGKRQEHRLPYGRGSASSCKRTTPIPNRDREGVGALRYGDVTNGGLRISLTHPVSIPDEDP
jgi:hypothetical protein